MNDKQHTTPQTPESYFADEVISRYGDIARQLLIAECRPDAVGGAQQAQAIKEQLQPQQARMRDAYVSLLLNECPDFSKPEAQELWREIMGPELGLKYFDEDLGIEVQI